VTDRTDRTDGTDGTDRTDVTEVLDRIARHRLVPVVVLDGAAHAPMLADALVASGLPVAEVTLRRPGAVDAVRELAARADLLVGAGTVISPGQVDDVVAAGARFVVSPGVSRSVVRRCHEHGVPVVPGVATASELMVALEEGVTVVKFFPAETSGGIAALKALAAPFPQVRFIPTGGVGPSNAAAYLDVPAVIAVGGSWMVPADALREGDGAAVTRLTREAVALVGAGTS
jgi:2-dehydro-3-deoxyphosphogluconate aldolase/(4S)-4-hydroxy-2-oxoglutarate aldolase